MGNINVIVIVLLQLAAIRSFIIFLKSLTVPELGKGHFIIIIIIFFSSPCCLSFSMKWFYLLTSSCNIVAK